MNQTSEIEVNEGGINDLTSITVAPGKQEVIVTRILNAPRELVYKTFTNPKHIPNWWAKGSRKRVMSFLKHKNLKNSPEIRHGLHCIQSINLLKIVTG